MVVDSGLQRNGLNWRNNMCLSIVYPKEKQNNIVKDLTKKGGWITVWKVVRKNLRSDCHNFPFVTGINKSPHRKVVMVTYGQKYAPYFHSWQSKVGARHWGVNEDEKIIKCKVRPSWITVIGSQDVHNVIVSRKIVIPRNV